MPITPAYDVGGLGRLADVRFRKRAESREERRLGLAERSAEQRYKIGQMQIQQMETNLQKIQRDSYLKSGLAKSLTNVPEGENKFTTGYNYLMMHGESEKAQEWMDEASDRIESLFTMDPEAATDAYNRTIGKATGNTLKAPIRDKKYGKVFESVDDRTGKSVWLRTVDGKPEVIEGYSPPKDEKDEEAARKRKTALRKEMKDLQSRIHRVKSKEGLMEMIMANPEFAASFSEQFGSPDSVEAKNRYLTFLENQLKELQEESGETYEAELPEPGQVAAYVFVRGKGIVTK